MRSNPLTPPGLTTTYISVVKGRKTKPSTGQIQVSNDLSQRAGSKSHQRMMAARGPSRANAEKIQHIVAFSRSKPVPAGANELARVASMRRAPVAQSVLVATT